MRIAVQVSYLAKKIIMSLIYSSKAQVPSLWNEWKVTLSPPTGSEYSSLTFYWADGITSPKSWLLSIGSLHFLELILKCIHHVKACGGLAPSYIAEILTTEELVCSLRVLQAVVGAFGIKTLHFLKNYLGRPGSEFVTIYEPAFIWCHLWWLYTIIFVVFLIWGFQFLSKVHIFSLMF